ncbi:hypothetical protein [Curtobacterium sp. Leaf183]|nr:hypothetical protein [Curtobacterium sp. Leaf183]
METEWEDDVPLTRDWSSSEQRAAFAGIAVRLDRLPPAILE